MNRNSLLDLVGSKEARRSVFWYAAGMILMLFGGLYALWRIELLSNYLAANRAYVLERDERWEKHIQGQADLSREILRRLPK